MHGAAMPPAVFMQKPHNRFVTSVTHTHTQHTGCLPKGAHGCDLATVAREARLAAQRIRPDRPGWVPPESLMRWHEDPESGWVFVTLGDSRTLKAMLKASGSTPPTRTARWPPTKHNLSSGLSAKPTEERELLGRQPFSFAHQSLVSADPWPAEASSTQQLNKTLSVQVC